MKLYPKVDELMHMLNGEALNHFDFDNPSVVEEGLVNGPLLPHRDAKDKRRNVSRFLSLKPRSFPKGCFQPVPDRDRCGDVEEVHILLRTWVARAGPNFVGGRPLKPWPSQSQSSSKFVGVENPETAKGRWPTYGFPIDLALAARKLVGSRPKESMLNLVEVGNKTQWDNERRQVIDGLRGENRFNKRAPAGHGPKSTIPSGQGARAFVLKMLKVHFTKPPHGKREPKISHGEGGLQHREPAKNVIKVNLVTSYRDHQAFLEVGAKARHNTKLTKDLRKVLNVLFDRSHQNCRIIRVEGGPQDGAPTADLGERIL